VSREELAMAKFAAYLIIGVAIGFGVAALTQWTSGDEQELSVAGVSDAVQRRLERLEADIAEERRAREALARTLALVEATLAESPPATDNTSGEAQQARGEAGAPSEPAVAVQQGPGGRFRRRGFDDDQLVDRFVDAGLAPDRAETIIRRSEELRLEALQARYDAARDGTQADFRGGISVERTLRSELGDADYEKYLSAMGRPTRVQVGSVLSSSPAAQAGFNEGDQIVAYAGQRIFDLNELTQLTFDGQAGLSVAVDVIRDGQQIQLYIPRGPLGITSGGRRFGPGR
jgi:hypothetical protein